PSRALPWLLAVLAVAPLPFLPLAETRVPLVFGAFVLVARQILALGMLAFWLAMGSLVPGRRAKTLFAPLAAGVTLGGIVGSFGSGPVASLVGVGGLIGLCVVLLAGSAVVGLRLRHSSVRRLEREPGVPSEPRSVADLGFVSLFRTSRLFRLLGIALLCGGALSPVLYFEFTSVLDAATQGPDGEQQLLDLYSQFRGWLNVAILVCQIWLGANLYRRIGLPLSMALWPVAYVMGFAWLGLDFALFAAFATFGTARVTEAGISDSAARVLYNLFPDGVRARATGMLEGPVNRLGGVLGNGFVLEAIALGGVAWIGWVALPVAGIWFVSALVLWRAYPELLLRASAEHGLAGAGIDRATLLDRSTLRSLAKGLVDPDPGMCRAAVDLVIDGEPDQVIGLLAEAIEEAPSSNRPLLVEALHRLVESLAPGSARSARATSALARSLLARPPLPAEERADMLRVYARLTVGEDIPQPKAEESKALLERLLGDRAAPVRLAAIAELHRRGAPPPGLPDLNRTLADALDASDGLIRRAARKELRAILLTSSPDERWAERLELLARHLVKRAGRVETTEALRDVARRHGDATQAIARDALRYAKDRDARVRGALHGLAGHAGLVEEGPRLVSALGSRAPEEEEGAREGLVALGMDAALPLLVGMEFGGTAQREGIVAVLRELEVDAATLEALRDGQLKVIRETVVHRAAVDGLPGGLASLLRRRLDERISEGLGALLDLLSTLHEESRIRELERRLRRSVEGRARDLLIEGIESLLGREEREAIVPLLESGEWRERAAVAARALGRLNPEGVAALMELCSSPDMTSRLLASEISLEGGAVIGDPQGMPKAMDTAVYLQAVPAFDRLSTQQLMALGELLQEQRAAAGESIYHAGDEGLGLYFVLEGEVELQRGGLVLERSGVGSFFGELSALDGVPRSEDAVASSAARLLRLDRDDLLSLLEEAPGLAIGLVQLLSSRVRRLEDRLEEVVSPSESVS
ncbi:MAG: cyclic nucleotide-binding domain-containing protein, partial [Deltaproteobacteria bacterium]|nr:cyclic nucleotide-binding domain-containing protein [Deltaproteobacteria bacterium]